MSTTDAQFQYLSDAPATGATVEVDLGNDETATATVIDREWHPRFNAINRIRLTVLVDDAVERVVTTDELV